MTMTDPIADMLTRIRNALKAGHEETDVPSSRLKINLAKILKTEGYIKNYKVIADGERKYIKIFLKYDEKGFPVISGLKRVSKPSCRIYRGCADIPKVLDGYGINIVSTSKGLITDKEARQSNIGGEIICSLW
ncbi:30S ribosomal subunit protein S8 [uncultured Desulfobacterium sp.]|uniref:Small ribosomal subunit protein uS8 n=1 Tax=uncultured Desulfobacterium sp. TaxID=201089 RepID=A0A445MS98_9BACT|nr:30S ribosomal subunit protein S8 [uncultured Desulfobacterium sp.]